jgi:probable DNA repair protein
MTDLDLYTLTPVSMADLPADSPIVCATLRLAQTLSHTHDKQKHALSAWHTRRTMTLGQWLSNLHEALALRGKAPAALNHLRVLNTFQEQLIWESVIQAQIDNSVDSFFDLQALAENAAQAHKLSIEWNIPVDGSIQASEEQQQFRQWQVAFRAYCQEKKVIDSASLHAQLIDHLSEIDIALLPGQLCFAGFDHYTVLEKKLHAQLRTRGIDVLTIDQSGHLGRITRFNPSSIEEECLTIATWARQHLAKNPETRLGIVAPNLETYQMPLQDALEDMLTPDHIFARNAHQPRLFNISLGQPLSNTPIVQCALTLLQLIGEQQDIDQSRIASLLHSPYWSYPSSITESDARARLDAAFRSSVSPKAPLSRYDNFAAWFLDEHQLLAPGLRQHLHALAQTANDTQNRRLPSEWRRTLEAFLAKTGWLAEGRLNSIEFQTRQAFIETLDELSRVDQLTGKLSFKGTIKLLNQLCNERLFQPKTRGTPTIQILGVLESTGIEFDALWFAGLTETNWPPAAHPNPLLSVAAQRQQRAPNACANVQLDFAQRIQRRLFRSAPEIMVSLPLMDGDTELQPSALIAHIPVSTIPVHDNLPWLTAIDQAASQRLDAIEDAVAPAVEPGSHVRGGTWLLKAQAICPAWGYYQYRLGAVPLEEPTEGLDARQRGTLVHEALEKFWAETKDHTGLKDLIKNGLSKVIDQSIDQVLTAYNANKKYEPLKPRQQALERNRLKRLLTRWLEMESERDESFTVLHCEHEFKHNIGGIEVRMFIDRIDQLADGRLLIIDYKTGANIDIRNWASTRLTEPQLPIYAAIATPNEGNVAGVAFGQVHLNKITFKGIGDGENLLPGVEDLRHFRVRKLFDAAQFPDWASVLAHWTKAIYAIAEEVCHGNASVCFANESDLLYCDVRPLLRLAERDQQFKLSVNAAKMPEKHA